MYSCELSVGKGVATDAVLYFYLLLLAPSGPHRFYICKSIIQSGLVSFVGPQFALRDAGLSSSMLLLALCGQAPIGIELGRSSFQCVLVSLL